MVESYTLSVKGAVIFLVIITTLFTLPTITMGFGTKEKTNNANIQNQTRTITSAEGVIFDINLNREGIIEIIGRNNRNEDINTKLSVQVDTQYPVDSKLGMSPGEERTWKIDTKKSMDMMKTTHNITISTFGEYTQYTTQYNFTKSQYDAYLHPHITNVKITNGTIDGEPSAVAKVTVSNPSIQHYGTKLLVNTEGTDGSFYPAVVPPGENKTITVELLESRGDKIAGEARLYVERPSKSEGAMDQVEFVGQAETETTVWNESYQPVRGPWRDESYKYENESIHTDADESESLVPSLSHTQQIYAIVGIALVAGAGIKRLT